jgi:hypothetical protein
VCVVVGALSWTGGDEECGSREAQVAGGLLTKLFERDRVFDRIGARNYYKICGLSSSVVWRIAPQTGQVILLCLPSTTLVSTYDEDYHYNVNDPEQWFHRHEKAA